MVINVVRESIAPLGVTVFVMTVSVASGKVVVIVPSLRVSVS